MSDEPRDIARETYEYQVARLNHSLRLGFIALGESLGFKMAEDEACLAINEAALENWADKMNEMAACETCRNNPEPHEVHCQ